MLSSLLIAGMILLYSFQTLFTKKFSDTYPGGAEKSSEIFCMLQSVFIALLTFAFNGFAVTVSPATLLLGALNALMLFIYNTSIIRAGSRGSYAFMNVVLLFGGILLPAVYSSLVLSEELAIYKVGAVALMLVSFFLMNMKEISLKNTPPSYYLFCALLFISNGLYNTLLKVQSVSAPGESREMIMLTFLLMGVFAGFSSVIRKSGGKIPEKESAEGFWPRYKTCFFWLCFALLSAGAAVNLLVLAIPLVNTVILYTVENGGVLLLSGLYSLFIFKEKINMPKALGMVLAVIAITLLSI